MKNRILNLLVLSVLAFSSACSIGPKPVDNFSVQEGDQGTIVTQEMDASSTQELVTIRMNRGSQLSFAPFFFAERLGYFEDFGIDLEMVEFNRSTQAIPLLVSGDLDVYAGTVNVGFINSLSMEPNIRVVADRGKVYASMDCTNQGIVVRRELYESGAVKGPADLKGLRASPSIANLSAFLIAAYLEKAELTMDDMVVSEMPPSVYLDALANDSVDIVSAVEPTLSQLIAAGDSVMLATMEDVVGDFQTSVLAFGKNLLSEQPELGARFLAAYMKGVAKYNEGKTDENLQILSEETGLDIEVIRNSCWLPISIDGKPDFDAIVYYMNWAIREGYLENPITEDQFWDPEPLQAAMKLLEE